MAKEYFEGIEATNDVNFQKDVGFQTLSGGVIHSSGGYSSLQAAIEDLDSTKAELWAVSDETISSISSGTYSGVTLRVLPGVTITFNGPTPLEFNITVDDGGQVKYDVDTIVNGNLKSKGNTSGVVTFDGESGTETLTINGSIDAGLWKIRGDNLTLSLNKPMTVYPEWWGAVAGDSSVDSGAKFNELHDSVVEGSLCWLSGFYYFKTGVEWTKNINVDSLGVSYAGFITDLDTSTDGWRVGKFTASSYNRRHIFRNVGMGGASGSCRYAIRFWRPNGFIENVIGQSGADQYQVEIDGAIGATIINVGANSLDGYPVYANSNGGIKLAATDVGFNVNRCIALVGRSTNGDGIFADFVADGRGDECNSVFIGTLVEANSGRGLNINGGRKQRWLDTHSESNGSPDFFDNMRAPRIEAGVGYPSIDLGSGIILGRISGTFTDVNISNGAHIIIEELRQSSGGVLNDSSNKTEYNGPFNKIGSTYSEHGTSSQGGSFNYIKNGNFARWDSDTGSSADTGAQFWECYGCYTGITFNKSTSNVKIGNFSCSVVGNGTNAQGVIATCKNLNDLDGRFVYIGGWFYGSSDWEINVETDNGATLGKIPIKSGQHNFAVLCFELNVSDWSTPDSIRFVNRTGSTKDWYMDGVFLTESIPGSKFMEQPDAPTTNQIIIGPNGNRITYGNTPSTGYWKQGDIVYKTAPTSGGNIGVVCTSSGNPGTWHGFGSIA